MTGSDVSAATPLDVRRTLAWMVASCLLFALVMVCVRLFLVFRPSRRCSCGMWESCC